MTNGQKHDHSLLAVGDSWNKRLKEPEELHLLLFSSGYLYISKSQQVISGHWTEFLIRNQKWLTRSLFIYWFKNDCGSSWQSFGVDSPQIMVDLQFCVWLSQTLKMKLHINRYGSISHQVQTLAWTSVGSWIPCQLFLWLYSCKYVFCIQWRFCL